MDKVIPMPTGTEGIPNIMVVGFSDVEIPEFKEVRNKDFVFYGKNNLYPQYLTYLYNKSAKHGAIINGKTKYIFGGGFVGETTDELTKMAAINRDGETWNDVGKKAILDNELYGGHYLMIIWNLIGSKPADIFHIEFEKLRADKNGGYWYKFNWADNREEAIPYNEFDPNNRRGVQIFAYKEYRPGTSVYPLPEYLPCNNYIETDIEISKFHLSSIRNGMMPSKAIEFFIGDPPDEKKREIEKRFEKKFSGAENAGKFVMIFNTAKEKSVNITDLSASELDKQFDILNKTCQQEIFTGHQVTSPMLFGIKEEGQLGGATELYTAYQIFVSNYAKPKRQDLEKEVNYFQSLLGLPTDLYLQDSDPIGTQIDVKDVINSLPKEYVFRALGIPESDWNKPNIGEDNKPTPTIPIAPVTQMSKFTDADKAIGLFSAVGEMKNDYLIVKTKKVMFSSMDECADDEIDFWEKERQRQSFLDSTISNTEASILDLIKKDKRITPDVIASVIDSTPEWVATKIASLEKRGYISSDTQMIGTDAQTSRTVLMPIDDIRNDRGTPDTTQIFIKYSYEGPQDSRNRDFCAKMLELDRLYSRFEIERISQELGYSVFDRRGGFWTHKDGVTTPYCRHKWVSNIVVKKGAQAV
jgi:hypothetical protein